MASPKPTGAKTGARTWIRQAGAVSMVAVAIAGAALILSPPRKAGADATAARTPVMAPAALRGVSLPLSTGAAVQPLDATFLKAAAAEGGRAAAPPTLILADLSPDEARAWNRANPISKAANPAARPFFLRAGGDDGGRAIDCLAAAVYYEAAYETVDGQRAVAQVVLNRMRHPAYPKTVCGVVFQGSERTTGCQFTFTCDGALSRPPTVDGWAQARRVAMAALDGYVMKKVGNATHYHAEYVAPYWSPSLVKVAAIGAHVFYRWTGGWGLPPAFAGRYAGEEPEAYRVAYKRPAEAELAMAAPSPMGDAQVSTPEAVSAAAEDAAAKVASDDLGMKPVDFTPEAAPEKDIPRARPRVAASSRGLF